MRVAEFMLPYADGDSEDAQLVVYTPNGPYFIKLTGPAKTIAKWERAFEQFVASLKVAT